MEQVQSAQLVNFIELNQRMNALITQGIQKNFGTPNERNFIKVLTTSGIEAAYEMIELINAGITYDIWKEFVSRINSMDGPIALFENEDGDMAKLADDYRNADMREVYEKYQADGVFTVEYIQADIDRLKARQEWARQLWDGEDEQTKAEDELAQVAKETVDAPVEHQ